MHYEMPSDEEQKIIRNLIGLEDTQPVVTEVFRTSELCDIKKPRAGQRVFVKRERAFYCFATDEGWRREI